MKYLPEFPEISFADYEVSFLLKEIKGIFGSQKQFKKYGPSVRQYFEFVSHMAIIYLILGLLVLYPIIQNANGNGLQGEESTDDAFFYSQFTLANQDKVILEQIRKDASEQVEKEIMERNRLKMIEFQRVDESYSLQGYDIFYSLVFLGLIYLQRYLSIKSEQTNLLIHPLTSDYAISVKGFPSTITDPNKLRKYIVDTFGINPREVTLARSYNNTLEALKDQVNYLFKILKIVLIRIKGDEPNKKYTLFDIDKFNIEQYYDQIYKLSYDISIANKKLFQPEQKVNHDSYPSKKGYIILESINDKMKIKSQCKWKTLPLFEGKHSLSFQFRVQNPDNIFWKNLDISNLKRILYEIKIFLICGGFSLLLAGAAFLQSYLNTLDDLTYKNIFSYFFSEAINRANKEVEYRMDKLAKQPRYKTAASQYTSIMKMKFILNVVNTVFIPLIDIDLWNSGFTRKWYTDAGKLVQQTILMDSVEKVYEQDFFGMKSWVDKHLKNPLKTWICGKKENRYETYSDHIPERFSITDSYTDVLNVIYSTMYYSSGIPFMIPFGFLYLIFQYFITNYELTKQCKAPPVCDKSIHKLASSLAIGAFLMHAFAGLMLYSDTSIFPPKNVDFSFNVTSDSDSSNQYKDIEIIYNNKSEQIIETGIYIFIFLLISLGLILLQVLMQFLIKLFYKHSSKKEIISQSKSWKEFENILDEPKIKGNSTYNIEQIQKYKLTMKIMNSGMKIVHVAKAFQTFYQTSSFDQSTEQFKLLKRILGEVKKPETGAVAQPHYAKDLYEGLPYYFQQFLIIIYQQFDIATNEIQKEVKNKELKKRIQQNNTQSDEIRLQLNEERERREELRKKKEEEQRAKALIEYVLNTLEMITNQLQNGQPQTQHYEVVPDEKLKEREEKLIQEKQRLQEKRNQQIQHRKEQKARYEARLLQEEQEKQRNLQEQQDQQKKQKEKQRQQELKKQAELNEQSQQQTQLKQQQQQQRQQLEYQQQQEKLKQQAQKRQQQQNQHSKQKEQDLINQINKLNQVRMQLENSIKELPQTVGNIKGGLLEHLHQEETENLLEGIYKEIKSEIQEQLEVICDTILIKIGQLELLQKENENKSNPQLQKSEIKLPTSTSDDQRNTIETLQTESQQLLSTKRTSLIPLQTDQKTKEDEGEE